LLTQSAVTQQIKALESEMDVPLFDRAAGCVSLTPAGAALLPFADRLDALAAEAGEAVALYWPSPQETALDPRGETTPILIVDKSFCRP
jgi:DNA-binding transcriptional LysR family regulator